MAEEFEFIPKNLLGSGWSMEVRKGVRHIGNIRKNPQSGAFQYFNGIGNILNYDLEEKDLDALKARIKAGY